MKVRAEAEQAVQESLEKRVLSKKSKSSESPQKDSQ